MLAKRKKEKERSNSLLGSVSGSFWFLHLEILFFSYLNSANKWFSGVFMRCWGRADEAFYLTRWKAEKCLWSVIWDILFLPYKWNSLMLRLPVQDINIKKKKSGPSKISFSKKPCRTKLFVLSLHCCISLTDIKEKLLSKGTTLGFQIFMAWKAYFCYCSAQASPQYLWGSWCKQAEKAICPTSYWSPHENLPLWRDAVMETWGKNH